MIHTVINVPPFVRWLRCLDVRHVPWKMRTHNLQDATIFKFEVEGDLQTKIFFLLNDDFEGLIDPPPPDNVHLSCDVVDAKTLEPYVTTIGDTKARDAWLKHRQTEKLFWTRHTPRPVTNPIQPPKPAAEPRWLTRKLLQVFFRCTYRLRQK